MPVIDWPPANAPAWPPVETGLSGMTFSDVRILIICLREYGFTRQLPTASERQNYFPNTVRCDEGHQVNGIMLQSPQGVRYPFAYCTGATHQQLLVLWGPDYCMGGKSGSE